MFPKAFITAEGTRFSSAKYSEQKAGVFGSRRSYIINDVAGGFGVKCY